jgi:SH3-like domain-containing protein
MAISAPDRCKKVLKRRPFGVFMPLLAISILSAFIAMAGLFPALAVEQFGTSTGLRIPRYVSLKSDRVNLREGPSKEHRTAWVFQRAGLPVEITAEFDNWRRIRDSEGSEGWVLHSLLSGRRTALVSPWRKGELVPLMSQPAGSRVSAQLQSGLIVSVRRCDKTWCRVSGKEFDGFVEQKLLWGVYATTDARCCVFDHH